MSTTGFGYHDDIPEAVRLMCMAFCEDVAMLHHKWGFYLELYSIPEDAELLASMANSFFQAVEESFRADLTMSICRLADPARMGANENLSFERLVQECQDVPSIDRLVADFRTAANPVIRYRHKLVGHNDLGTRIQPHVNPLPGIGRPQIDAILKCARAIMNGVYWHYAKHTLGWEVWHIGGAKELLHWLKTARDSELGCPES